MKNITSSSFFRFIVSGILAAATEYSSFLMLNIFIQQRGVIIAQTISYLCGFIVSFYLNRKWVFKSDNHVSHELVRYSILAGINIILTNAILVFLVDQSHISQYISKIIIMVMVACWNYVLFQRIIFKTAK